MLNSIYYTLKPLIPRRLQIFTRRQIVLRKLKACTGFWPIDDKAKHPPTGWQGWPDNKRFAIVLTHDVDTAKGQEKSRQLMELEKELGFRSVFNFVPERYNVSSALRNYLTENGFEVGVHGLNHDGKLYSSREVFQERALRINEYLKEWQSSGFRSPAMHHNLEWIHDLNIEYDASTFDTDPFEPQPKGMKTIFPFRVSNGSSGQGYIELPYTLPQDFTLFILMKEKTIDIWKKKLDWISENGGMALMNTHPDYINFNGKKLGWEEYPARYYSQFLEYVRNQYSGQYWSLLPRELARFCASHFS
jgi:peptidoglycan/xylan/chitin deacetylase (PgdA/CDA1 family)